MKTVRAAVIFATLPLLGGCADYLNHHDTVTLRAGEAQRWNRVVQATDPWPVYVTNTDIDVDAQRVASAGSGGAGGGGGAGGPCNTPDQRASDGSRCGGRAASEQAGGR